MFSERNYNSYNKKNSFQAVPVLIAINVIVFLFQSYGMSNTLFFTMALSSIGIKELYLWQFITYMFLHGGFLHLLLNMWVLFLFGRLLEQKIGSIKFLLLYFISGITGALLWILLNWNSFGVCIGASAAGCGVLIATAMLFPDVMVMPLIPPIPMKLKTLVIVFLLIEIFLGVTGQMGVVAHFAHIGGLIGGYFYMRFAYPRETFDVIKFLKSKLFNMPSSNGKSHSQKASKNWTFTNTSSATNLDAVLDKISQSGINSLSEKELEILRKARDKMRKKS